MDGSQDPIAWGLPHREPFIFIDRVLAHSPGDSALCSKVFLVEDPIFRGHFPGDPIVPGVLLVEALAQTAGIAVGQPGGSLRLAAIRAMKFFGAVRPGEELRLRALIRGGMAGLWQSEVTAQVDGRVVAEGVLVLAGGEDGSPA